jgi:hypothetical protein
VIEGRGALTEHEFLDVDITGLIFVKQVEELLRLRSGLTLQ